MNEGRYTVLSTFLGKMQKRVSGDSGGVGRRRQKEDDEFSFEFH